jgi:hypothetical protein
VGLKNGKAAQHVQSMFGEYLMVHRYEDQAHIRDVITSFRPTLAVELGTAHGGFAAMLAATLAQWGGRVLTADITQDPGIAARLERDYPNLSVLEIDVLTEPHPLLVAALSQPRAMLYTDNGNKPRELELYAHLLPAPALVGTHDYGTEVDEAWAEPFMTGLGFMPYQHERFAALANDSYWDSLTRFWLRTDDKLVGCAQCQRALAVARPLYCTRTHGACQACLTRLGPLCEACDR